MANRKAKTHATSRTRAIGGSTIGGTTTWNYNLGQHGVCPSCGRCKCCGQGGNNPFGGGITYC